MFGRARCERLVRTRFISRRSAMRLRGVVLGLAVMSTLALGACAQSPHGEGYVAVPGGRVWYSIVGGGLGTPLLVVHGGPGIPSRYLAPLSQLADQRPVIFYDQLGAGRSDHP